MKKLFIILLLSIGLFISTYASDLDILNQKISILNDEIKLINQQKEIIKNKYNNAIMGNIELINVKSQQNAWEMNKYGLGFSSGMEASERAIQEDGDELLLGLQKEMNYNLGILDNEINTIKLDIKKLEEERTPLIKEKEELRKIEEEKKKEIEEAYDKGLNYFNESDYKNAIVYLNKALLKSDADFYNINYYLGLSYYNLGNYSISKDYFNFALEYAYRYETKTKINKEIKKIEDKIASTKNQIIETEKSNNTSQTVATNSGVINDKLNSQVNAIFTKLEKKLSKLDEDKKIETYKTLSKKLSLALKKSKNTKLNTIISLLITKIDNYVNENSINLESEALNIINN